MHRVTANYHILIIINCNYKLKCYTVPHHNAQLFCQLKLNILKNKLKAINKVH